MNFFKLLFFISIFLFLSCGGNLEEIKQKNDYENAPDVSVENIESIVNSNSTLKAKVKAPVMNNFARISEPYMEFPKGVKIEFYDENLKVMSSLTADYAIYYTKKKLWRASQNVYITNVQGGSLETDEIYGDEVAKKYIRFNMLKLWIKQVQL